MARWYGGVGSRETPIDVWNLMYNLGLYMAYSGWGLSSGGATKKPDAPPDTDSADDAFLKGAMACPEMNPVNMLRIYLINAHWEHYKPDPSRGFYNSREFTETWDLAMDIARQCRGSWEGLRENGIALHTRNAFQMLGHDLVTPVQQCIGWAPSIGKGNKVKGGTNTAFALCHARGIPVMNLYEDEQRQRAESFVKRAEERYGELLCIG